MWTALSILASAIRRNVWINQGIYTLYPNLFVALVAPPGKVGKSTVIRMGRRILLGVDDIIFGPDSVTREELIAIMAKTGVNEKQSAITLHSTELSSLIEPSGLKMIQFLTDIYDCDFKWRYETKGAGRDKVHNPVLNLLAGTTPTWIAEGLPADVVGHGFSSRMIFVYGDTPRYLKPFPGEPDPRLVNALTSDLQHISLLEGEFQWSPEARDLYEEYYGKIASSDPDDYRIEGFHNRKRTHILKMAMLLSLSEGDELIIHPRDISAAWDLIETIEVEMPKSFSAVGKYEFAADLERILRFIKKSGEVDAREIYDRNYAVGDHETVARILITLHQMGRIERVDKGKKTIYRTTGYYREE